MSAERLGVADWPSFLRKARPFIDWSTFGTVLCLDPGETTGVAQFENGELSAVSQWTTRDPSDLGAQLRERERAYGPFVTIVYEEYRVRGNKFKEHVGSEVVTIQHIGVIKYVADELGTETWKQTAGQVKAFATDSKLRRWGLYQQGLRHANDAVRHGVYYHLFVAGRE